MVDREESPLINPEAEYSNYSTKEDEDVGPEDIMEAARRIINSVNDTGYA